MSARIVSDRAALALLHWNIACDTAVRIDARHNGFRLRPLPAPQQDNTPWASAAERFATIAFARQARGCPALPGLATSALPAPAAGLNPWPGGTAGAALSPDPVRSGGIAGGGGPGFLACLRGAEIRLRAAIRFAGALLARLARGSVRIGRQTVHTGGKY